MRTKMIAAATVVVALALAGCGSSGGDGESGGDRSGLVDAMVSEGATEEQANCFIDEVGDDAERLFEADDSDLSDDDMTTIAEAVAVCDPEAAGAP